MVSLSILTLLGDGLEVMVLTLALMNKNTRGNASGLWEKKIRRVHGFAFISLSVCL